MTKRYTTVSVRTIIASLVAFLLILLFGMAPGCEPAPSSGVEPGQSRYEQWQKDRPFTIGAKFYDHYYYPEASGIDVKFAQKLLAKQHDRGYISREIENLAFDTGCLPVYDKTPHTMRV